MTDPELHRCRVCGVHDDEPPWGESGYDPTFAFCPCCGAEHGYQDATLKGVLRHREIWLSGGAIWDRPRLKPADWVLEDQLALIPAEFKA